MATRVLPKKNDITICFAHPSYQLLDRFSARNLGIKAFEVRDQAALEERIHEADVLLVSGMLWRNDYLERASRLAFLQSVSAGMDYYDKPAFTRNGIRLASAQGTNAGAVAEHALALMLSLARKIPTARDNQNQHQWRAPIAELDQREDELDGKTLVIVGLGRIGSRLAALGKALNMKVIGVKRDPSTGHSQADRVVSQAALNSVLSEADYLVLTCPLTPETENLIDAEAISMMKRSARLVNVARGKVVDEPALISALERHVISGAALDCVWEEPLPASSALWEMRNVLITPHTGGETARFEDNLLDVLEENLDRLGRGESKLVNEVA